MEIYLEKTRMITVDQIKDYLFVLIQEEAGRDLYNSYSNGGSKEGLDSECISEEESIDLLVENL
jgi:hypothetical protein